MQLTQALHKGLREAGAFDKAALIAHGKTLIAGCKCPRSLESHDSLPVTAAGKLKLRKPFRAGRQRRVN